MPLIYYIWAVTDLEIHEPKTDEDVTLRENLEAAASWYNKFLGFRVIGGAEGNNQICPMLNTSRR
jgi:hypothetical protein